MRKSLTRLQQKFYIKEKVLKGKKGLKMCPKVSFENYYSKLY